MLDYCVGPLHDPNDLFNDIRCHLTCSHIGVVMISEHLFRPAHHKPEYSILGMPNANIGALFMFSRDLLSICVHVSESLLEDILRSDTSRNWEENMSCETPFR